MTTLSHRFRSLFSSKQGEFYQEKRDNLINWQMIEAKLSRGCHSLLDVACDIGFYTVRAAERGMFTIGLDRNAPAIERAKLSVGSNYQDRLAFLSVTLGPHNIDSLPKFDAVLCLSVFHHFCRAYGEESARSMMLRLMDKCEKQMFFQLPSKIGKFKGKISVDFNHDQDLVERYVRELFESIDGCTVALIGKKEEKPPTEDGRYLFLVEKVH